MFKKLSFFILALTLSLSAQTAFAQDFTGQLDNTGTAVYGTPDNNTLFGTLGILLNVILSTLGIILLMLVIYAGFLWMTAGGNDTQVKKAKDILINATVGMILMISAYAISQFVVTQLAAVTG